MTKCLTITRSMLWTIIKRKQEEKIIDNPMIRCHQIVTYKHLSLRDMVIMLQHYGVDILHELPHYIPMDILYRTRDVKYHHGENNFDFQIKLILSGWKIYKTTFDDLFD